MFRSIKQTHQKRRLNKNVTVVIRGVAERTEELCKQLLSNQIHSENIFLIHETPFSKALKKTFEIGIREKRKWTLAVDADVLVRSNILNDFYERAEKSSSQTFVLHTQMLDKFFGGYRAGGLKLYRTSLLPQALPIVPEVANRPEGFVAKSMHKQGFYLDITDLICGLHDFEQYYADIFRKGFTHGIKHEELLSALLPYWQRMSKEDTDFRVLLGGYEVAKKHGKALRLDKDEAKARFASFLKGTRLKEKGAISREVDAFYVDETIEKFILPKEYKAINAEIEKRGRPTIPKNG